MTESRRPLVQHGGPIRSFGPDAMRALLVRAFEAASEASPDTLTHGFHTWTARMHPAIAYTVIDALVPRDGAVLDPFTGSGTVPIEAFVSGRRGIGADLNPLAPLLGRVKSQIRDAASRSRLMEELRDVGVRSEDRVRTRAPVLAPVPASVARMFEGHVLKELAGLREEILTVENVEDREAMRIVLSSILVKMSKRRADSSSELADKRLRKGLATELFLRKGRELVDRFAVLAEAVPKDAPRPRFLQADVRTLGARLADAPPFDLVLSSPPYGGTYDYADHHALRYAMLDVDPLPLHQGEIGSRRRASREGSLARWDDETHAYLEAMRARVHREGHVVLVVGDGHVEGEVVPAIEHLADIAPHAGLALVAAASEPRSSIPGGPLREEHLVCLAPSGEIRRAPKPRARPQPSLKPSRSDAPRSRGSDAGDAASTRRSAPSPRGRSRPTRTR